jgi:hypothetical protein
MTTTTTTTTTTTATALYKAQKLIRSALELIESFSTPTAEVAEKVIDSTAATEAAVEAEAVESVDAVEAVDSTEVPFDGEFKAKTHEGVNRSEKIRDYFNKHGMSVRNKDVIDYIKKTYNTEVGPAHVSIIRKNMSQGKAIRTGKVKVKAKAKAATPKAKAPKALPKAQKSTMGQLPMSALCTSLLKKHGPRDGLKLSELTDLVIKSGYSYKGDKGRGGVLQNVYQALHSLSKEGSHIGYKGESPVIVKDPTSKRYRINPKAKKVA